MQTGANILIVVNPTSGRTRGKRMAETVADLLRCQKFEITTRYTTPFEDAEAIVDAACNDSTRVPSCVVACGGDGTIQQVANALANARERLQDDTPVLGIAPAGRCNDFAAVLGIGKSPNAIVHALSHGAPKEIDLGRVNGRYFCTVATLGFDAEVSGFVDRMPKFVTGMPAYLYGTLRILARYKSHVVRLEADFGTIERPIFLASSANTAVYGGGIKIAPSAVPTDGRLDLCVIDAVSKFKGLLLLLAVLRSRHATLREVSFHRTSRLRIESAEPLELWADGERIATTPATVEIVPSAVRIMLPAMQP